MPAYDVSFEGISLAMMPVINWLISNLVACIVGQCDLALVTVHRRLRNARASTFWKVFKAIKLVDIQSR